MNDKKKEAEIKKEEAVIELNLDDLEKVTGGSMRDVSKKKTTDISKDTAEKV